jgi:glycosyltransferase involved in cell wall biosynthesis
MTARSSRVRGSGCVLVLASDAHGRPGGIAQYNRDVLQALSNSEWIEEVLVLPRLVDSPKFIAPPKVRYDLGSAGGVLRFLFRCAMSALFVPRVRLVYCAHVNLLPVATVLSWIRGAPLVLAIYGIDAWSPPKSRLAAWCARRCAHVVSISQITLDRFKFWAGSGARSYAILPNAIRPSDYGADRKPHDLAARLGLESRTVIMTFGRMSAEEQYKGFDQVLEILTRLRGHIPDIAYLIAGDGSDRERLEAKARSLGVSDLVVFAGHVSEAEKADHYRLADAYVMPSSGEGFGFVVLEALACGLPVVASRIDGTREAVKSGELGILVDPGDPEALEHAVLEALSRPKGVPPGIDHFSFSNFERRLNTAVVRVLDTEAA